MKETKQDFRLRPGEEKDVSLGFGEKRRIASIGLFSDVCGAIVVCEIWADDRKVLNAPTAGRAFLCGYRIHLDVESEVRIRLLNTSSHAIDSAVLVYHCQTNRDFARSG